MSTIKFESRLELWTAVGAVGVLRKAMGVHTPETVNGEYYVTFAYPKLTSDEELYAALVDDNDIVFPEHVERGQRFRIKRVQEIRQGKKIYKVVEAHHIALTLGQYFLDDYIDFAPAQPPANLLVMLGNGTPFTFVVEGNFTPQDIFDFGEKSKLELLRDLCSLYGAELAFNNYTITFTTRKGSNNGAVIRFRKNMKGIQKTVHSMERITRLYGYGKNGLTIEGHAGHVTKFIDSVYFDAANPFMGKVEFPEIEDQGRLLQEMQKYLAKYEIPNVSYELDFVELEKVDPEFEVDRIREAGDTVTVFDEEFGYSFDARVNQRDQYPFEPKHGGLTLANFREFKMEDYIFQATVASKKAMVYTSKNAVLKGVKYDDSITLVDGVGLTVSDDFNRRRVQLGQIGPGDYGFVAFNKTGDRTLWLDADTGDAKFAGVLEGAEGVFSGTIHATGGSFSGNIDAYGTISGGTISGATITGGTITGGTITGGTIEGALINGGIITGSTVQTKSSGLYPRAALNATNNLLEVQTSATRYVNVLPHASGYPSIEFGYDGKAANIDYSGELAIYNQNGDININSLTDRILLQADADIRLRAPTVYVDDFTTLRQLSDGSSLTSALNAKVRAGGTQDLMIQLYSNNLEVWLDGSYQGKIALSA